MSAREGFDLWPIPSPRGPHSPNRLPGITPYSTSKLRELLKKNHEEYYIFFDSDARHNHISHHMLALWSLGADAEILQAGYNLHSQLQRSIEIFHPTNKIRKDNFNEHLGDRSYYKPYLEFFTSEVEAHGGFKILEEYIFPYSRNFGTPNNPEEKHPEMLGRFMGGLLHPIIHIGYGAEFGLPGMFAEGLAQIALTSPPKAMILPESLFTDTSLGARAPVHAFTILARIMKDEGFNVPFPSSGSLGAIVGDVRTSVQTAPVEYAMEWLPDSEPTPELVEKKVEELNWMVVVICSVSGFRKDSEEYTADFIAMHLVTSSLFAQSIVPSLSPKSQALFLRSYFAGLIISFTTLGRPKLDLEGYFVKPIPELVPAARTAPPASPSKFLLPSAESPLSRDPNPWLTIVQRSIVHPDDHVPKFIRALFEYASKYGSTPKGYFANTELEGASTVDGTLFLRAALLTLRKVGREVEKMPVNFTFWDRRTFREEGRRKQIY